MRDEQTTTCSNIKDVKILEQRIMKLKGELEERNIENKKTLKNTTKLCEYIIS